MRREGNRANDIRRTEPQRKVELLGQRANDQTAELEALRASKRKQKRAIRPLNRAWYRGRAGARATRGQGNIQWAIGIHSQVPPPPSHDSLRPHLNPGLLAHYLFLIFFTSCISNGTHTLQHKKIAEPPAQRTPRKLGSRKQSWSTL